MEPEEEESTSPTVQFVWLLIEIGVEGEPDVIPVTMPVPIMEGLTLDQLRIPFAHRPQMVEARFAMLYGEDWLAGRRWSVYGDRVITESVARRLFPHDTIKAGRNIVGQWGPDHE